MGRALIHFVRGEIYIYFVARKLAGGDEEAEGGGVEFFFCLLLTFGLHLGRKHHPHTSLGGGMKTKKKKCIPKAGWEAGRLAGKAIYIWVLYPPTSKLVVEKQGASYKFFYTFAANIPLLSALPRTLAGN
jgi:hypothetical protein